MYHIWYSVVFHLLDKNEKPMSKKSISLALLILLGCCTVVAQPKKENLKFLSLSPIQVDGNLEDWPLLHEITADSLWAVAVGHHGENLYVAVRVINPMLQVEAARNGIQVNINTDGKKRDGAQLVFPVPDAETIRAMLSDSELRHDQIRNELISRSRGYRVKGFPMIVDGLLSFENTYGIQAKAKVSEDDQLLYEAVIPLEQLRRRSAENKPIAVQILINNRWREMQQAMDARASQQQRGMYGYGMPTYRPAVKTPFKGRTEVWIVDKL